MKKCYYPDWQGKLIIKDHHCWDRHGLFCIICGMPSSAMPDIPYKELGREAAQEILNEDGYVDNQLLGC